MNCPLGLEHVGTATAIVISVVARRVRLDSCPSSPGIESAVSRPATKTIH
jgi:hypothetical protein